MKNIVIAVAVIGLAAIAAQAQSHCREAEFMGGCWQGMALNAGTSTSVGQYSSQSSTRSSGQTVTSTSRPGQTANNDRRGAGNSRGVRARIDAAVKWVEKQVVRQSRTTAGTRTADATAATTTKGKDKSTFLGRMFGCEQYEGESLEDYQARMYFLAK